MTDLDSLEQRVDLDCQFIENFLDRASSPDIMGQDMSSNKQETLDRALDCFLQMTLGIINIETLHIANIQAVKLKNKKVMLLSKYVDCQKNVTQNQSTVVSGTLAQASLHTLDSFDLEPGHIWNFKYLKYLDSLKPKFVQDSVTIGALMRRNSVTDSMTQAMLLDKALDCSVKLIVSISTIEMLHLGRIKPDNLATMEANHTDLMDKYNSCLKSLNQSTTIPPTTKETQGMDCNLDSAASNQSILTGAMGPPTTQPAEANAQIVVQTEQLYLAVTTLDSNLDSAAICGDEYTDEAASADFSEQVSSVEYAGRSSGIWSQWLRLPGIWNQSWHKSIIEKKILVNTLDLSYWRKTVRK